MKLVSPLRLRVASTLVALIFTFSLVSIPPASATPKAKKRATRSAKSKAKVKAKLKSRSSRATVRRRTSRSGKYVARSSRKRGRFSARGRSRRPRWRRQVATSVRGAGVHNYLSQAWTQPLSPAEKSGTSGPQPSDVSPGTGESATDLRPTAENAQPATAPSPSEYVMRPRLAEDGTIEMVPMNPLVAAYADSLASFGFSPDNQGFIVTTLNGDVLAEHNADRLFNPASVTKIATSLTAISRLGPDFKFRTSLYTDGTFDPSTGVLNGSLYVIGSGDPGFFAENAMMIADKLNRSGIREVDGNLVVLGQFYYNFSTSRESSAKAFRAVLTPETWNASVKASYPRFLAIRAAEDRMNEAAAGKPAPPLTSPPSLKISGQTITDPAVNTSNLTQLAVHTSLPLLRVLKGLNDFSNNWMAHVIGNLVGGPDAVERFLKTEVGFKDDEVSFATSSGLGANAISPRGTITMLRKLIAYLDGKGLRLEDVLPVAGVDRGTLERRFNDAFRGSVVAKTGTLSGVSALAGVAYTRLRGPLLFVIYNYGGSTYRFRSVQDETLRKLITLYGGPVHARYVTANGARVSDRTAEREGQSTSSSNQR